MNHIKLILLFVSITVSMTFVVYSTSDGLSGDYIGLADVKDKNTSLRLHLDQSGKSLAGYMIVVKDEVINAKFEIESGVLDEQGYAILQMKWKPEVDISAEIFGIGLSGPALAATINLRSTEPLKSDAQVIRFSGTQDLGGFLGFAMFAMSQGGNQSPKARDLVFRRL